MIMIDRILMMNSFFLPSRSPSISSSAAIWQMVRFTEVGVGVAERLAEPVLCVAETISEEAAELTSEMAWWARVVVRAAVMTLASRRRVEMAEDMELSLTKRRPWPRWREVLLAAWLASLGLAWFGLPSSFPFKHIFFTPGLAGKPFWYYKK